MVALFGVEPSDKSLIKRLIKNEKTFSRESSKQIIFIYGCTPFSAGTKSLEISKRVHPGLGNGLSTLLSFSKTIFLPSLSIPIRTISCITFSISKGIYSKG